MIEWRLDNECLALWKNGVKHKLSGSDILEIENGKYTYIDGELIPKVSDSFPDIDFNLSFYYSTIKVVIYTPATTGNLVPYCQLILEDPTYVSHRLKLYFDDYCVVDNLFLLVEKEQAEDLLKTLELKNSGPLGFQKLSIINKYDNPYISIIESDEHCFSPIIPETQKSQTRKILFPYQLNGVEWMAAVCSENVGFVLADEMGLGKTVQIITVLDEQKDKGPSLLIAPNSLLENWSREINRFAPWLTFHINSGKGREHNYRRLFNYNVVITSYEIARSDFAVLGSIDWNLIVLDEAQMIKNYDSKQSKEIRVLPKRCGIAVTGTPLENRLTDIWSIYDFCFPGLLGELKDFRKEFSNNIECAERLEQIISPLMLRRKVRDVRNDLPNKVINPIALEMTYTEAEKYEEIRSSSNTEEGSSLGVLQKLRSFCAFPNTNSDLSNSVLPDDESSKFSYLFNSLLPEIFTLKEKTIIFTGFKEAQRIIKETVKQRFGSFCGVLNGDVPKEERQTMIDEFSDKLGFAVLIINPTVGATGLNIVAANHVIFYTLDWNPATEDQCIARALRIGQEKIVMVYRLYYVGTVEEEVNECIEKKRLLQISAVKGTDADIQPNIFNALSRSPFIGRGENDY